MEKEVNNHKKRFSRLGKKKVAEFVTIHFSSNNDFPK